MNNTEKIFPAGIEQLEDFKIKGEIRDPIYNYIRITELESKIIDTHVFQRLDRLYQNPVVRFVYPNATHTRKAHSLGVMHLYHKAFLNLLYRQNVEFRSKIHPLYGTPTADASIDYLDNLGQSLNKQWWDSKNFVEIIQTCRLAALLHDVGHGPFSHLFEVVCNKISQNERSFNFDHEKASVKIVETYLSDLFDDTIKVDDVLFILKKEQKMFLHEILDGPFDVDKLDYISRDSYHAGTKEYGSIDYERIIDGFRVKQEKLLISKSSIGALMSSFNALYLAYTNIYFHRACRIFDHMITDALEVIPDFVKEIASDVSKLVEIDDVSFLTEIKSKKSSTGDGLKFEKSWNAIKDVLDRKKRYAIVDEYTITFAIVQTWKDDFTRIKSTYEEKYKEIKLIVDFTPAVRGLRIDPMRTFDWLIEANIIDENDPGNPTSLKDVSGAYYRALSEQEIHLFLFVDKSIKDSNQKEGIINKAKNEISGEIETIKNKVSLAKA